MVVSDLSDLASREERDDSSIVEYCQERKLSDDKKRYVNESDVKHVWQANLSGELVEPHR